MFFTIYHLLFQYSFILLFRIKCCNIFDSSNVQENSNVEKVQAVKSTKSPFSNAQKSALNYLNNYDIYERYLGNYAWLAKCLVN